MTAWPHFLRPVLLADAATSAAAGVLMLAGASLLAPWLGLPETLLRYAGLLLIPFAAAVAWTGTRQAISRTAVQTIAAINAGWVVGSVVLLVSGWVAPTALGVAFVVAQALAVALFAALQAIALRAQPGMVR